MDVLKTMSPYIIQYGEVIKEIYCGISSLNRYSEYHFLGMRDLCKLFDNFTNSVKYRTEDGDIESKCKFVVDLLNIDSIKRSINFAIDNRSMHFYNFAESLCNYLEKIAKFTDEDFENVVKQYIRNGGCLTSNEYRNLNLIMNRRNNPKILCYYIEIDPEVNKEFVIYRGSKYRKYLEVPCDTYKDVFIFKPNASSKMQILHRELWKDFYGKITSKQYVIFKDSNKDNLTLNNLVVVNRNEYSTRKSTKVKR